jgi:hypothetical protein
MPTLSVRDGTYKPAIFLQDTSSWLAEIKAKVQNKINTNWLKLVRSKAATIIVEHTSKNYHDILWRDEMARRHVRRTQSELEGMLKIHLDNGVPNDAELTLAKKILDSQRDQNVY